MITFKRESETDVRVKLTVIMEVDEDVAFHDLAEAFEDFALACGYDAKTIKDYFAA